MSVAKSIQPEVKCCCH